MTRLVVTGYASLDHVFHLDGAIAPDRTTQGWRDPAAWPRAGGCPTYVARAVARAGQNAAPLMWVGSDAAGERLRAELARDGVVTDGVAGVPDARSPVAVLAYQPDGACSCLFDPGFAGREELTEAQRALIAAASHLCLSVGPGHLTAEMLALRPPRARLYWAVKNDPACFPAPVCDDLAAHADVIFCSAAERGMVGPTDAVIVETLGGAGLRLSRGGDAEMLHAETLDVSDTTGAGDTLVGGFIAAEMAGAGSAAAARAGLAAAAAMLMERQENAA